MNSLMSDNRLTVKKTLPAASVVVAMIIVALFPTLLSPYSIIMISSIISFIVMSVSWTIFSGPTGYTSLASAAFFGAGIYVSAFLSDYLPLPVVMLIGGCLSSLVAIVVGAITLRLRGVYFTIFTFGLVELLKNLVLWLEIKFSHTRGRFVASVDYELVFYCLLVTLALVLLLSYFIKRSRFGLALKGIGESEDAASHIGINTTMVKILGFALSAFTIGAVGAAMATRWSYIDPGIAFNMMMSFMPVLMAIFGGINKLLGPVIGAAVFAYLEELLITKVPEIYMIIFGVIMIIAILFLPNGLIGLVQNLRKKKGASRKI